MLGFEHIYQGVWNGVPIFLKLGSTALALFSESHSSRLQPNPSKGISHFALLAKTFNEFKTAQQELKSLGMKVEFQDHDISHSICFNHPDGHRSEITTYDVT